MRFSWKDVAGSRTACSRSISAAYAWLCVATAVRAARFPVALWADLASPRLVFSFFTIVAANDVLALGMDLRGFATVALGMWLVALSIWLVLIYLGFAVLTFLNKAGGAKVIDGGWLNAIVGTQSLVILGTQVALLAAHAGPLMLVFFHMLWVLGLGLYGILIVLLCYRMFFVELKPDDVNPQLWVIMGAAAISTNAGSTLVVSNGGLPFLLSIRPFIDGVTFAMWAWATWSDPASCCCSASGSMGCTACRCVTPRRCGAWYFRSACTRWPAIACRWSRRSRHCGIALTRHGVDRACRRAAIATGLVVASWRSARTFACSAPAASRA